MLLRHLRWCEKLLLDLRLAIDGCPRGRTPFVIDGALLASFLKSLLSVSFAIVSISFQLMALLSPAHFVFLMNALWELSQWTLNAIQGLKSE